MPVQVNHRSPWPLAIKAALLAVWVGLAYANSFSAGWHLDDFPRILDNPDIRITSLTPAGLFRAMIQDRKQNRPFSNLSFALNYYFQQDRPAGYHAVNLAFHLFAAVAVFLILGRLFRKANLPEDRRELAALAAAAIWAVHPLHTQAVTYIVQRQTVMASAFMLGAFAAYLAGREAHSRPRRLLLYLAAFASFVLAAGSKEIALVTPVLILLCEFYFYQNFSLAFLRRHRLAAVLALLVGIGLSLLWLRPEMLATLREEYQTSPFTLRQRLLTEPRVLFSYLGLILFPLPSSLHLVHHPQVSTSLFSPGTTLPALLAWLLLLAAALRSARRHPWLSFALLWYLLNLALESSFPPIDLMNEHRLYLPSLAVIVPLVAGAVLYLPRVRWSRAAILAIGIIFLLDTRLRNQVWQNEITLWRDEVRKEPLTGFTHFYLGTAALETGSGEKALRELDRSLALTLQESFCQPGDSRAGRERTEAICRTLRAYSPFSPGAATVEAALHADRFWDQALPQLRAHDPIKLPLLQILINRGFALGQLGQWEQARADADHALALNPNVPQPYLNRGFISFREKRYAEAIGDYTQALALNPRLAAAYNNRGLAYRLQGRYDLAVADHAQALRLDPDLAEAYQNLGVAYLLLGQIEPALQNFDQALARDPQDAISYYYRGRAYEKLGQADKARADLEQARQLEPELFPTSPAEPLPGRTGSER